MTVPALVAIRPEPGLSRTIARGRAAGLTILGCPLFAVAPVQWTAPPVHEHDALLIGSANALRHGGDNLLGLRALPVWAVGAETAAVARACGFTVARTGAGGLQALLDAGGGERVRLLRLAGRAHVPVSPPPGISISTRIVYEVQTMPLPAAMTETLGGGAVVLVHSGEAAVHLGHACDRAGVPRSRVGIAALALRVAEMAGSGWRAVATARTPDDPALLAVAAALCKDWR